MEYPAPPPLPPILLIVNLIANWFEFKIIFFELFAFDWQILAYFPVYHTDFN